MTKVRVILLVTLLLLLTVSVGMADQRIVLEVEGMTCSLCSVAVKRSLTKIDGVKVDSVSYKNRRAYLTVEDSVSDKILIQTLAEDLSYTGKVLERIILEK